MDKINATKNNADGGAIGNSKQPLIRTMTEDIETLKHDLSQAKPAPKNLLPKDLPVASSAAPAPAKKPQTFNGPPFIPFAGKQKPEAVPQKTVSVRPEDNLSPIARLARQGPASSANLMPREEKTPAYRPASQELQPASTSQRRGERGVQTGPAGAPQQTGSRAPVNKAELAPSSSVFKKGLITAFLAAFAFFAYYFLAPALNKPTETSPPAEIPPSLVAGAKDINISAEFDSGLIFGIRKYLEDNKNRMDVYGVSRLVIKNIAGTEILKIKNLKDFLGINPPAGFLEAVDKNHSLLSFNYPENNYLRLGLVFKIVRPEIISQEASSWEPAMFGDLQPLFLGAPVFYDLAKNFTSNAYLGASVRYLPLGEPGAALNYAIDKNKKFFMLATSKDDIYYLIEKTAEINE